MEQASEFDDQESLTIPADHMLAIIMDSDGATGIVETLNHDSFSPNDIGVLSGMEDAAKLDAASGKKGFFAKLATAGVDMGDRDTDYIKQYRRAVLNGRTVIAVAAKDNDARDRARQILRARGARFITFFDYFFRPLRNAGSGSLAA
jgi:hypothetical protein